MAEMDAELLNVYDGAGNVVGQRPRAEAKRGGLAVGAVNALVRNGAGLVLLQRRPPDKENGGLWDKTVGGHVSAGEAFDETVLREAGEELFDDAGSTRVALAADAPDFARRLAAGEHLARVLLVRAGLHLNLRDVRRAPGGGLRNVTYHVASYLGRTELAAADFRPQPAEIDELRFFAAAEVDAMLLAGALAPNMAFLWLARGHELLA
jgi:ADP-ribose pyrophosphatase YjhB (NUDIX family)